ncbi:MAG: FHA domain-containing protein [Sedimentisphaerales bacterium]|nr:FHA domain-containing protein [Sedimentisphaerales bacterium]
MHLVVKENGQTVNEFQFDKGPIYIGRQENSQVFLRDGTVSRQHAVIFSTQDGKWMVEDLDSANKTYLNDQAIHKSEIKTGDSIRITSHIIEINLKDGEVTEEPSHPEDTLTETAGAAPAAATAAPASAAAAPAGASATPAGAPQIIERKLDTPDAPTLRLPAHRVTELLRACEVIGKATHMDELLLALLDITSKQLGSYHIWCALRNTPEGPMTCHAGRTRDGQALELNTIQLNEKINEGIEKSHFLLFIFSKDMTKDEKGQIRSVIISPVVGPAGCFGVLYANNTFRDEHYSLSDLDYLMLLGMHVAAAVQKL